MQEKQPSSARVWLLAARPKTLFAACSPVVVGSALAIDAGGFHPLAAVLALAGAVLIQVGTNFYNDYADFVSGTDTEARKGPTRVTQAGFVTPRQMKIATALAFGGAVLAGIYLMWRGGWPIVVVGFSSIMFGVLYTAGRFSLSHLGIADVFVLIFFGPVAVGGTYYVQVLDITREVVIAGFAPGLLSVAILLVNNIRDIDEDRAAGKRTLVVRLGREWGVGLYATCIIGACTIPPVLYWMTASNGWSLLALAILPAAVPVFGALRSSRRAEVLNPLLGKTAGLLMLYSVLFSVGWVL